MRGRMKARGLLRLCATTVLAAVAAAALAQSVGSNRVEPQSKPNEFDCLLPLAPPPQSPAFALAVRTRRALGPSVAVHILGQNPGTLNSIHVAYGNSVGRQAERLARESSVSSEFHAFMLARCGTQK